MKIWLKKHPILLVFFVIVAMALVMGRMFSPKKSGTFTPPLKRGSIMECVYGIGVVASNKTFQVKSGIPSQVHALFVKEGELVEEGAKLVELQTVFTAPFAGTITSIACSVGETVFPQTTLIHLEDLKDRSIMVNLDQMGALRVQKGQKVRMSFDGLRDQVIEGIVSSVFPHDNRFLVRIDSTLPPQILPGMAADVAIEIVEHQNVLLIPILSIDKNQVIVKRKGQKPHPITIQTGLVDGKMAEVTSNELEEGDELLLKNEVKG